jgi:hypothetical protein
LNKDKITVNNGADNKNIRPEVVAIAKNVMKKFEQALSNLKSR